MQLWRFLLDLLTDARRRSVIRWQFGPDCAEGEFVMAEPEAVARLWGETKKKVGGAVPCHCLGTLSITTQQKDMHHPFSWVGFVNAQGCLQYFF